MCRSSLDSSDDFPLEGQIFLFGGKKRDQTNKHRTRRECVIRCHNTKLMAGGDLRGRAKVRPGGTPRTASTQPGGGRSAEIYDASWTCGPLGLCSSPLFWGVSGLEKHTLTISYNSKP